MASGVPWLRNPQVQRLPFLTPEEKISSWRVLGSWRGKSASLDKILDHLTPPYYIEAFRRTRRGRVGSAFYRAAGMVPGVLVGRYAQAPVPIMVRLGDIESFHHAHRFTGKQYDMIFEERVELVAPGEIEFNPQTEKPAHVTWHRQEARTEPPPLNTRLRKARDELLHLLRLADGNTSSIDEFTAAARSRARLYEDDVLRRMLAQLDADVAGQS
jgi:ribosomal protein L25 (general stress protein Ctc)